jgi:hypothetical protein
VKLEIDADGADERRRELVIRQAQQEARLARAWSSGASTRHARTHLDLDVP